MAPDRAEQTASFRGKSLKFVADWLKKNKLSKLKSVFEGTFIIMNLLNECARIDARMDGVRNKERNISPAYLCIKM